MPLRLSFGPRGTQIVDDLPRPYYTQPIEPLEFHYAPNFSDSLATVVSPIMRQPAKLVPSLKIPVSAFSRFRVEVLNRGIWDLSEVSDVTLKVFAIKRRREWGTYPKPLPEYVPRKLDLSDFNGMRRGLALGEEAEGLRMGKGTKRVIVAT